LVLFIFAALTRRYVIQTRWPRMVGDVVRTSIVFALLAMGLSFFAHTSAGGSDGRSHIGASPAAVFGWALVLTSVVGLLVVLVPFVLARLRADPVRSARADAWLLPIKGGLAALTASVALGGAAFLIAIFADHTSGHPPASVVGRALPVLAGFFVNIGLAATAFASGANVGVMGGGADNQAQLGYAHLHALSSWYFLMLLLPILATLAGVTWMLRHRRGEDDHTMWRACYRMAGPYAVGWVVLAWFSRVSVGAGLFGGVHAGPQLLIGFGLALGWTLVVGVVIGQVLLRRGMPRSGRPARRLPLPSWSGVALASAVVILALILIDVASGGAAAAKEPAVTEHVAVPLPRPLGPPTVFPQPAPTLSINRDFQTQAILSIAGSREQIYQAQHATYTTDPAALGLFVPPGVSLTIVRADTDTFCMTARALPDGQTFSYSNATARAVPGDVC
jgi:hypothetical protein